MKKIILLIPVLLFLVACSNENSNNEDLDITQKLEFSAKGFFNSTIAYKEKGEIKLGVTKDELLNSFNDYSTKFELGFKAGSYKIEKIDNKNYIRFYNDDGSVSTIALIDNQKKGSSLIIYRLGGTVCRTTECANCCGCIPDGSYCTRCEVDLIDCERTTTSTVLEEV